MIKPFIKLSFMFCLITFHHQSILSNDNLVSAINAQDITAIQDLLNKGADPNLSRHGRPLRVAARSCYIEGMEALLDAKANPNITNNMGNPPLMSAALGNCTEGIELLLSRGADPNHRNRNGDTAFMSAIVGNHASAIGLLVSAGGSINSPNNKGNTPLTFASSRDKVEMEMMGALLAHGADPYVVNPGNRNPLQIAVGEANIGTVTSLLNSDVSPDTSGREDKQTPLMTAVEAHSKAVKLDKLEIKPPPHILKSNPRDYIEIMELLLGANANIEATSRSDFTALMIAAIEDNIEAVRFLLAHEADPSYTNAYGYSALSIATLNGDIEIAQLIKEAKEAIDRMQK